MILVDSSIWIDHIREPNEILVDLIERGQVLTHPFVIGEIALGVIRPRAPMLASLEKLPAAPMASHAEAMRLIEIHTLFGRGVGYVDVHLLAAALLGAETTLWTRDRRLAAVAGELGVAARFVH